MLRLDWLPGRGAPETPSLDPPIDTYLHDDETVIDEVSFGQTTDRRVIVTDRRVLTVGQHEDGQRFDDLRYPNLKQVNTGARGVGAYLKFLPVTVLFGLLWLGIGIILQRIGFAEAVQDVNQATPALATAFDLINTIINAVMVGSFVLGGLLMAAAIILCILYLVSRSYYLEFHRAGGDPIRLTVARRQRYDARDDVIAALETVADNVNQTPSDDETGYTTDDSGEFITHTDDS